MSERRTAAGRVDCSKLRNLNAILPLSVPFSHPRAKLSRNGAAQVRPAGTRRCLSSARSRTQRLPSRAQHRPNHRTRNAVSVQLRAHVSWQTCSRAHVARPGHEQLSHVSRPLPSAAQHRLSRPHDGQPLTLAWQNCRNAAGVRHQRCILASVVVTAANARGDSHGARKGLGRGNGAR